MAVSLHRSPQRTRNHPENSKKVKETAMSAGLDRIDLKILRLLQADGRMANAEIAERSGTSAATCHRRIQRLFTEGFVRAVRALVDPARVGRGTLVFVGVVLDRSTPESFSAFEAAVRAIPVLLDCHLVAGDFDYILKVRVSDMADFNRLHSATLIGLPGVRQTRTFFVMKEVIDNAPLDL
jgi:Lrp/AsnC family leucine-responsive transcriptional regulator